MSNQDGTKGVSDLHIAITIHSIQNTANQKKV